MTSFSRSVCIVLTLLAPSAAHANDAPQIMRAPGGGVFVVPHVAGGEVDSAWYKAPGLPWIATTLMGDNMIRSLRPFAEDRTLYYEVWNAIAVFTDSEACIFGAGEGGSGETAPGTCWIEAADGSSLFAGHVMSYGLDDGGTMLAAAAFQWSETPGSLGLALVVEGSEGTGLWLMQYDEGSWEATSRTVVEVPGGLGSEIALQAWSHDGVLRVVLVDDHTWWVHEDPLGLGTPQTWEALCAPSTTSSFLPSTLRVSPLQGDAPAARVSVQDGGELLWAEFADADEPTCGAIHIPGPEGVVATELDGDLGLYTLAWQNDAGGWSAALVGSGGVYGYAGFGDVSVDLDSGALPGGLAGLDPGAVPDTWYAAGGDVFVFGEATRPELLDAEGFTIAASGEAALALAAGPLATADQILGGEAALAWIVVEDGDAAPTVEVLGERALVRADLAEPSSISSLDALGESLWLDSDVAPYVTEFVDQAEALLGASLSDVLDAAVLFGPGELAGDASLSAMAADGFPWQDDAPSLVEMAADEEEIFLFGRWFRLNLGTRISYPDFAGSTGEVEVEARTCSGFDSLDGAPGSQLGRTAATVVAGGDDERAWSVVTSDPDTPLYDSVLSLLYPVNGDHFWLTGVEATALTTRGEVTATYTVDSDDVISSGPLRGFVYWGEEGIALEGDGTLELAVNVVDESTGERTAVGSITCQFAPDADGGTTVTVTDSGSLGMLEELPEKITTSSLEEGVGFELTYTLRSASGGLVTLQNAVGFGFTGDSDGDGLFDDDEIGLYGTDPLLADTDGDGVDDGTDPWPTEQGVGSAWLAEQAEVLATDIEGLDLSLVDAANDNAASGRLSSMATRAHNAAESFEEGRISSATALLDGLLDRVDGSDAQEDWLVPGNERTDLVEAILLLLELAAYE